MPDTRRHRGPHPGDGDLFAPAVWPTLRAAVAHLSWLLTQGYAAPSALALVGNRFALTERQRRAVLRSSCSDAAVASRSSRRLDAGALRGERLDIDGFNVLTSVEAALAGGVILHGRDGCYRDMASMHGSYRKVAETRPALELLGAVLEEARPEVCRWYLDRPVSNSGRLSTLIREIAAERGWPWETELVNDPDALLARSTAVVASADSLVLDRCGRWFNLARDAIARHVPSAVVVPLFDVE